MTVSRTSVKFSLSSDEYLQLSHFAEKDLRSIAEQAHWFICQAIEMAGDRVPTQAPNATKGIRDTSLAMLLLKWCRNLSCWQYLTDDMFPCESRSMQKPNPFEWVDQTLEDMEDMFFLVTGETRREFENRLDK